MCFDSFFNGSRVAYSPGFGVITKTTHDLKATQFETHQKSSFDINDCENPAKRVL